MDSLDRFDDEPPPEGEFTLTALANWLRAVESRATRLFSDSRYAPREAYGGRRLAT